MEPAQPTQTFDATTAYPWLSQATLTSRIPLWSLFPFYSKRLVDTVHTEIDGSLTSCFRWFRFHARNGRFRYDPLPDIVVRVTQVIDGVENVLCRHRRVLL